MKTKKKYLIVLTLLSFLFVPVFDALATHPQEVISFNDEEYTQDTRGLYYVFIKTINGSRLVSIQTSPNETVYELKIKIMYVLGPLADKQRLFFAGMQLQDERTLSDYNILNGYTIYLL